MQGSNTYLVFIFFIISSYLFILEQTVEGIKSISNSSDFNALFNKFQTRFDQITAEQVELINTVFDMSINDFSIQWISNFRDTCETLSNKQSGEIQNFLQELIDTENKCEFTSACQKHYIEMLDCQVLSQQELNARLDGKQITYD